MTEQAQQKAQKDPSGDAAEIAAVVAILLAGPPLATAVAAISAALKTPKKLILGLLALTKYKPGKKTPATGSDPVADALRKNLRYRAAYLINAVRRLATADDLTAALAREKKLFAAHLGACKRRVDAARKSAAMSDSTGNNILGWGGVLDDRTTPDCRWLIGKNYAADNPPEGLHPGGRHPRCRCFPLPASPGKPVVTALPHQLSGNSTL
jgi:hypothetical protein